MSSLHQPLIDIKPDPRGSPFLYSPDSLQSPQQSQNTSFVHQSQAGDMNHVLLARLYGAPPCAPKPGLEGFQLCFQDCEGVQLIYTYDVHTPSPIDHYPSRQFAISDYSGGSTPPLSASSSMSTPVYHPRTPPVVDLPSTPPAISGSEDGNATSLPIPPMLTPIIWSTCICGCHGHPCIRQKPYRRPKGDPLEDHLVGELITFRVHGRCGMSLLNALAGKYHGLSERDDPMFNGSKTSISLRIEWPGCSSWASQMRTKDWKRKPSPITKAKLATEIAKKVQRFLKDTNPIPQGSDWNMPSSGYVDLSRLQLVALEHVSLASWQPHLRFI